MVLYSALKGEKCRSGLEPGVARGGGLSQASVHLKNGRSMLKDWFFVNNTMTAMERNLVIQRKKRKSGGGLDDDRRWTFSDKGREGKLLG